MGLRHQFFFYPSTDSYVETIVEDPREEVRSNSWQKVRVQLHGNTVYIARGGRSFHQ